MSGIYNMIYPVWKHYKLSTMFPVTARHFLDDTEKERITKTEQLNHMLLLYCGMPFNVIIRHISMNYM